MEGMSDASVQPDPSDPFFANPVFGTGKIHQPGPVIPATAKEFPEPEVTLDDPEYGHHSPARRAIRDAKRVVVKIGSSSLTDESGHVSPERIDLIADALEDTDDFRAALVFARKRAFGPFRRVELDEKRKAKEFSAFARNGFSFEFGTRIMNMSFEEAEELLAELPLG